MTTFAGILIGGHSRRMGTAKAMIRVDGATLLERTIAVAAEVADEIALVGSPPFDLPKGARKLPLLEDLHPGIGPIGGLETVLQKMSRGDASEKIGSAPFSDCLLLACDMPRLRADVLAKLREQIGEADAAVCTTREGDGQRLHPCCALYRPRILPVVREAIEAGRYSMMQLLSTLIVHRAVLSPAEARCVDNWNEPSDLTDRFTGP